MSYDLGKSCNSWKSWKNRKIPTYHEGQNDKGFEKMSRIFSIFLSFWGENFLKIRRKSSKFDENRDLPCTTWKSWNFRKSSISSQFDRKFISWKIKSFGGPNDLIFSIVESLLNWLKIVIFRKFLNVQSHGILIILTSQDSVFQFSVEIS